jgi:mitochondrial splicing suppressor protein 51
MALATDLAMRTTLSGVCAQCSNSLRRQGKLPRGIFQAAQQRRLHTGRSSFSPTSETLRPYAVAAGRSSPAKRFSSSFTQRLFGGGGQESAQAGKPSGPKRVLAADDLFHSFTDSPIPEIRRRAAFIKQHAACPHPDHHSGASAPAHVNFECPDCGIPVYCSKEHWADHYEAHLEVCDTLRQINEDDHDLRSGRFFPEFEYAGPQIDEALVNMTNWDTFLYTRGFQAINDDRSMRQATRLLTYPITIASVLHELSPYNIQKEGRLTVEGLKSLSGRHT